MHYVDGFVLPVPKGNRERFIEFANHTGSMFIELGALRILECWPDDVPGGTLTDFRKAVQTEADEEAVFAWIEWPDKQTRDRAMEKMRDPANTDPRMDRDANPVPFNGMRMIFGGFQAVVQLEK
jgi:uncharacterized protein YbaA (DUF1428 family)